MGLTKEILGEKSEEISGGLKEEYRLVWGIDPRFSERTTFPMAGRIGENKHIVENLPLNLPENKIDLTLEVSRLSRLAGRKMLYDPKTMNYKIGIKIFGSKGRAYFEREKRTGRKRT